MNSKLILAFTASLSMSACSTIVNGSNQLVSFDTGSVVGADCIATGGSDKAMNKKFTTPVEIKIPRSKKTVTVECNKAGYETGMKQFVGQVEGSTGGNILLGGPIGLGVDALSGAIYKYPDVVSIEMIQIGVSTPTVTGGPIT